MAAVTVEMPDTLYAKLQAAAKTHQRSLDAEILYCIQRTLNPHKGDLAYHVAAAKAAKAAKAAMQHKTESDTK